MKSMKILGIAVATLGIAASVGGAIALYTHAANPVTLGISQGTYSGSTGAVNYLIDGKASGSVAPEYWANEKVDTASGIADTVYQVKYTFPLSVTYSTVAHQTYTMGNLGISLTNVPATLTGVWASIEGYQQYVNPGTEQQYNAYGYQQYSNIFMNEDVTVFENNKYEDNHDISVASDGGQSLVIYLKFNNTGVNYLEKNEGSLGYSLSITWKPAVETVPYVVGTGTDWQKDTAYNMAVNLLGNGKEWMYNGLVGSSSWTQAKCTDGTNWSGNHETGSGNFELADGTTYDVYWSGVNDAVASFTARS